MDHLVIYDVPPRCFIKKRDSLSTVPYMLALPIFPGRLQPSIVGRSELNFRVRDGNGWTLALINTNSLSLEKEHTQNKLHRTFLFSQEN